MPSGIQNILPPIEDLFGDQNSAANTRDLRLKTPQDIKDATQQVLKPKKPAKPVVKKRPVAPKPVAPQVRTKEVIKLHEGEVLHRSDESILDAFPKLSPEKIDEAIKRMKEELEGLDPSLILPPEVLPNHLKELAVFTRQILGKKE